MKKAAATFMALLLAPSALAGPRSLDDCEKIEDPMAYNACLASFGPSVKSHGGGEVYPGVASEGERKGGARSRPAPHPRGARVARRGPHGRMHMEFTPGWRGR